MAEQTAVVTGRRQDAGKAAGGNAPADRRRTLLAASAKEQVPSLRLVEAGLAVVFGLPSCVLFAGLMVKGLRVVDGRGRGVKVLRPGYVG